MKHYEDDIFETYDPDEGTKSESKGRPAVTEYEITDEELFDDFLYENVAGVVESKVEQAERRRSGKNRHARVDRATEESVKAEPRGKHKSEPRVAKRKEVNENEDNEKDVKGGDNGAGAKKQRRKIVLIAGDKPLMVIIASLLIISVFVMLSSTLYKAGGTPGDKLSKHMVYMGIGLAVFMVIHAIRYQAYRNYTKSIFLIGFTLTLISVVFGVAEDNARRDLVIPYAGISFQPFELLKIGLIMLLANQLASRQAFIDKIRILPSFRPSQWGRYPERNKQILMDHTLPIFLPIVLSCMITYFSVGNSTTLIILCTCMLMLFIGRVNTRDIGKLVGLGVVAAVILFAIGAGRADTGKSRLSKYSPDIFTEHVKTNASGIEVYDNPEEAEQSINAKMSIASGGPVGKGPGMSTHRSNLQAVERDFVYAFIIEEYGLLGGMIVLALYLWLFSRGIIIFKRCGTAFPSLLVLGLSMMILFQALFHMAVSVSLLPVTGQQLPLISKGGTSMLFTLLALGMILGVSRQTMQNTLDTAKSESLFESSKKR